MEFFIFFFFRVLIIYFLEFPFFGNTEIVTLVLDNDHLVNYQREVAKGKLH